MSPNALLDIGPGDLGRSLVVLSEDSVPHGWADARHFALADEVLADPVALADLVDQLHRAWVAREPVVVVHTADFERPRTTIEVDIWRVTPDFSLLEERLWFLLWANSIDAREIQDPRLGAEYLLDDLLPEGVGIDGGPLEVRRAHTVPLLFAQHGVFHAPVEVDSTAVLASDQQAAVDHRGGPLRVIAPAGSGKTRVLTERARLLLSARGVPSSAVCLVAFNVRAADEMRDRTADLGSPRIKTLNGLGLAVLNSEGPRSGVRFDVVDESEVRRIIDGLVELPRRTNTDLTAPWIEALSMVRLGLRSPNDVEQSFGGDVEGFAEFFGRYRAHLADRGAVDFDEQIYGAIEVLLRNPVVRARAQSACQVLLVDEFQDLTPAHLLLIRLLASPRLEVFGVGDDDQTIYGFNGATPDWLIHYDRYFPGAKQAALEVNYRCPPDVVDGARTLLSHNRIRVDKEIRSAPGRAHESNEFRVEQTSSPVTVTVDRMAKLIAEGAAPSAVAVLTRVNATLAPVQVAAQAAGIPTTAPIGPQFLTRTGVRSALAWLRLAGDRGGFKAADIAETARRPSRGLSPKVIEWMAEQRDIVGLERLAGRLRDRDADKIQEYLVALQRVVRLAASSDTATVLRGIRIDVGLSRVTDSLDASRGRVDRSSHGDDLDALIELAALSPDPRAFGPWLVEQFAARKVDPGGVELSSIHRVKGREWDHVIVHGVDAGIMPHRLALIGGAVAVEEERRVFHVAITRAAKSCMVVASSDSASPYVRELAEPWSASDIASDAGVMVASTERPPNLPAPTGVGIDEPLRERLREWRRGRARELSVPAYVIFNDKTIDDLLSFRPDDEAGLLRCRGIGPAKLDAYGDDLLAILAAADTVSTDDGDPVPR